MAICAWFNLMSALWNYWLKEEDNIIFRRGPVLLSLRVDGISLNLCLERSSENPDERDGH